MSELKTRTTTYKHVELRSVEAKFPAAKQADHLEGTITLTITIEQSIWLDDDGDDVRRAEVPRMRINPSHGFAGYSRAESDWIARTVPELWDEWERRVGADGPKGTGSGGP